MSQIVKSMGYAATNTNLTNFQLNRLDHLLDASLHIAVVSVRAILHSCEKRFSRGVWVHSAQKVKHVTPGLVTEQVGVLNHREISIAVGMRKIKHNNNVNIIWYH